MKTLTLFLTFILFSLNANSQNITNTLGTSGVFTIKNGSTNYLTLNQSTGQVNILKTLRLEYTANSTTGVIYVGTERFLHNYGSGGTFLGINSGNFTMSGFYNTAVGFSSLAFNTTGSGNTALGMNSLALNTTGYYNTALGMQSLGSNTTGYENTAVGYYALLSNTYGADNTAVGFSSLGFNTTGYENTAIGYYSLYSNTLGADNTAVGNQSLFSNTTGNYNTALGMQSLRSNLAGIYNTGVGYASLSNNNGGFSNTAVGMNSLLNNVSGFSNTAVGTESLPNSNGSQNTALGYLAGQNIYTGSNVMCLGYFSNPTSTSAINQITLGNNQITSLRCNVTTITSLSDARDKKNIHDLTLGLDFISKLKPRLYNWDKREWYEDNVSDGSKMQESPTAGFIAQELDEVQTTENAEWLNLVLKDNPEKWEATPGNLFPVVVKAIQELKAENDELKDKLARFEKVQELLVNEINKIKSKDRDIKEIKLGEK